LATPSIQTAHEPVLEIRDLTTCFDLDEGRLVAVDGVSLRIDRHRTLGVIGESGCGKSVMAKSVLQILPKRAKIAGGKILLHRTGAGAEPIDLAGLPPRGKAMRAVRGGQISMIFQEPMTSLSPVHTVGDQVSEIVLEHITTNRRQARRRAEEMLARVKIPDPAQRMREYAHQLSGGLRQRVMIAMALACEPQLLIADEPTTALDVTVQAQILALMKELQKQLGMAILFITHDLAVIARMAGAVAVMYLGQIVEYAPVRSIFNNPLHPYTVGLLAAVPRLGGRVRGRLAAIEGTVPLPINLPETCRFFDRCDRAKAGLCDAGIPEPIEVDPGHFVRCALYREKQRGTNAY
jgi:peptide/nickel transport system ATP-binding protein